MRVAWWSIITSRCSGDPGMTSSFGRGHAGALEKMANVEHLLSIGHVLVLGPLEHQVLAVHVHGELAVGVLLDGAEGAEQPDDRAPLEIVSDGCWNTARSAVRCRLAKCWLLIGVTPRPH